MRPIPIKLRKQLDADPTYHQCLRKLVFDDHECKPDPLTGRLIEWEHALYYAGKQLNESWAIVSLCWWAHRGPGLNKRINEYLALSRATEADLAQYSRENWRQRLSYLNKRFSLIIVKKVTT